MEQPSVPISRISISLAITTDNIVDCIDDLVAEEQRIATEAQKLNDAIGLLSQMSAQHAVSDKASPSGGAVSTSSEPSVLSPAEVARMRHEEYMMIMRINLAEIELEQKRLDVRMRELELAPREAREPREEAILAAHTASPSERVVNTESPFAEKFFDATIEWINANPPEYLHSTCTEYYQRYYEDRYAAGVAPISSDHFGKAMRMAGYVIRGHPGAHWHNTIVEAQDREAVRQWILNNPPGEFEQKHEYVDRCSMAKVGTGLVGVEDKMMTELGYRQQYLPDRQGAGMMGAWVWRK
jgi:hypothetical protein